MGPAYVRLLHAIKVHWMQKQTAWVLRSGPTHHHSVPERGRDVIVPQDDNSMGSH